MTVQPATNPERAIKTALELGVAAITTDPTILNSVLRSLDVDELARVRAYWADHPPDVFLGFLPLESGAVPAFAVTLLQETTQQDYVGNDAGALWDNNDGKTGNLYASRLSSVYGIHVWAESADVCAYYYRVARRIMNVARWRFESLQLQCQVTGGQDMIPDPQYAIPGLFLRRLTVTVELQEEWDDSDELWSALNGDPAPWLTADGSLTIARVDADQDEDGQVDGGVDTYTLGG